jgi:2-haloacid dehalogenase
MREDISLIKPKRLMDAALRTMAVSSAESTRQDARTSSGAPSIIVFDVNETLLDIESMAPFFEKMFGDRKILHEWFTQLVLYSNVITLSGYYQTFFTLGQGVLEMLGTIYGVSIKPTDLEELRVNMLSMPAHSDVPEGLRLLKEAGFRLMTLTNSPPEKSGSPLERAGLAYFIERQFSVDSVHRFKPARQVYQFVAEQWDVPPSAICLVAAHTWDTVGAQSVGFSAGLVTRAGNAPLPVNGLPQPQAVAPDLPAFGEKTDRSVAITDSHSNLFLLYTRLYI